MSRLREEFSYRETLKIDSKIEDAKNEIRGEIPERVNEAYWGDIHKELVGVSNLEITQRNTHYFVTGAGWLSSPDTYIASWVCANSEWDRFKPFFGGITGKGHKTVTEENFLTGLAYLLFGFDGFRMNEVQDTNVQVRTKWRKVADKPIGIIDFELIDRESEFIIQGFSFAKDEILYVVLNLQNCSGMRLSFAFNWFDNCTSTHHYVGGKHIISVVLPTSESNFFVGCTPSNEWYNGPHRNPDSGTFPNTEETYSATYFGVGVGYINPSETNQQIVFGLSLRGGTVEDGVSALSDGLNNWKTAYEEAITYWDNFWANFTADWSNVPERIREKGYLALMQLHAISYQNAVSAGVPFWRWVWVRDACWPLRAIARAMPDIAKDMAAWWATCEPIDGRGAFAFDGTSPDSGLNGTDANAVFLIAMGEVYAQTQDVSLMQALKSQLDSALTYAQNWYHSTQKHIRAWHPHDYWDDYTYYDGEIDTSLVKYESVIDVFWLAALQKMAPVYDALGDTERRDFCSNTASGLTEGLEDYRDADGGFHYAIKWHDPVNKPWPDDPLVLPDDLYDDVMAGPANIYGALLLNDAGCRNWLFKPEPARRLGLKYLPVRAAVQFSNVGPLHPDASTTMQKDHAWGPHIPIVAAEGVKLGYMELLSWIERSFPIGSWPEDVEVTAENPYVFSVDPGCPC